MPAFVPWSVPVALGLALGVALHAALLGAAPVDAPWILGTGRPAPLPRAPRWPVAALAAALALPAIAAAARTRRARVWLLLPLMVPVGFARHGARQARPDPLAPLAGRTVELAGRSDGRLLRLDVPRGVAVALRPVGAVPRGRVRVRGRLRAAERRRAPGGFDERAWLRRRGGAHVLAVERATLGRPGPGDRFRARVRAGLVRGLDPPRAALMRALVLGEREDAGDLRDRFARAGLAHLLALSGLHLGVLAGAAGLLLAPLGPVRWALVAGLAVAFATWIGASPSLARAAAMTAAAGLSAATGAGRPHAAATLALAAAGTLALRPDWLFDLSFVLSYGSLLGILALGAPLAARVAAGVPTWRPRVLLGGGLIASVAATAAPLPWALSAFGQVPLLGPVVNLPALPLASLAVPTGLAAGLAGAVWPPLAAPFAAIASPLAGALLALAELGATLPALPWGEVGAVGRALWVVALLPWAWTARGALRPWRALAVTAGAALVALLLPAAPARAELVAIDVGQGDAFLLRLPRRVEVLVDGGGTPFSDWDVGAEVVVPALRALGVDELELVVASHADADHVEGLAAVLREMPVGTLAHGRASAGTPAWDALVSIADARGVPRTRLARGQRIVLGEAEIHVLHPDARSRGEENEDSVALRIDWRGRPFALLLGDVGTRVEAELAIPPAPLLVAPHHGSPGSTSEALLRAARPEVLAVSVGRNRYGHPARAVLARAEAVGAVVRRTDRHGTLRFVPAW